jgi:hypothetical protein
LKKRILLVPIWQRAETQLESESGPAGLFFPLTLFYFSRGPTWLHFGIGPTGMFCHHRVHSPRSRPKDFHRVACSSPLWPTPSRLVPHSHGKAQHYLASEASLSSVRLHWPTSPPLFPWSRAGGRWRRCREGFSPYYLERKSTDSVANQNGNRED